MSREDFLSLIGEKPPDTPVLDSELDGKPAIPPSPTALKLDDFSIRRGKEVLWESVRMSASMDHYEDGSASVEAEAAAADFHALAFEPEPELVERCADPRRHAYVKALMENPDYQALHAETMLDDVASEMAAAGFAEQWAAVVKTEPPKDEFKKELEAIKAAGKAVDSAKEEVKELSDARDALGMGKGGEGSPLPASAVSELFKRVRKNQRLRRICELAGKYRRLAQARQRMKTLHGQDDMVGVVMDGDVGRLLPHELAKIDDEDLELDLLRRIVERQALCREWRGIETKARGPVCFIVDESGSMGGEKICTAKALALAMAWIAMHQKRWCCLIGFSGGTSFTSCVIPPGKTDQAALMDWLEHFAGGGTNMDVPLDVLPGKWDELGCPKGKTDIVMVTDAICHVEPELEASWLRWKAKEQAHVTSIIVGGSGPGDLTRCSDKVFTCESLGLEEEAVGDVLSV